MAETLARSKRKKVYANRYLVPPPTEDELPYDDGEPMESENHVLQLPLLRLPLVHHWKDRDDYCVGTNMFLYFSPKQVLNEDFKGPDAFVVLGVPRRPRKSYLLWYEEFKAPNVVIEILSPSTIKEDKVHKKKIYQDILKVPEYFWCDPFSDDFAGFSLQNGKYRKMKPDAKGMLHSEQLGLALTRWQGVYGGIEGNWLRWATSKGILLPTAEELAEIQSKRAQRSETRELQERRRAEEESRRTIGERNRAEEERKRAEHERKRAEKLAALLKFHGIDPNG